MLTNWKEWLLNVLYPPKCPVCGQVVGKHGDWCPSCLNAVWRPRLINGSHVAQGLDGCYALTDYRGGARHVLHSLKYRRSLRYEKACLFLLERFPWGERLEKIQMAVPVPLSRERYGERGFNQSEVIFRTWAERQWLWKDILCRTRHTSPQWGLNRQERRANIKRAIQVREDSFCIRGQELLLVDDIYTTGATMHECARVLKQKGATAVTGLVIASGAP